MGKHHYQETDRRRAFLALACLLAIPSLALSACASPTGRAAAALSTAPTTGTAPTPAAAPLAEAVWLVTPDEIAEMEREPGGEAPRGPICEEPLQVTGNGPQVEFVQPSREQREVPMRFSIHIRLTPRQAAIDRSTLRVIARLQLPAMFNVVKSKDITDRVRPLWGADGIQVPAFEAPRAGCYQIEIQVADEGHQSTVLTRGLVVKKP